MKRKPKKGGQLTWARLYVPPELADLFYMIAKAKHYPRKEVHLLLYRLLKEMYPEDVEKLTDFLNTRQFDRPPSGNSDED